MSPARGAAALAGLCALGGALAAVASGPASAALSLPCVGLLLWWTPRLRRGGPNAPRRLIGLGGVTAVWGLALAAAGAGWAGLALAAGGLAMGVLATRLALAEPRLPAGAGLPALAGPGPRLAAAADLGLGVLWESAALLRPLSHPGRVAAQLRDAVDRYDEAGWLAHPERAHPAPPPLEKPELDTRELPGLGRLEWLRFASEYEPADPEIAGRYRESRANRTAHALLWRHGAGPRPTLVCVHGFGMGRPAFDPHVLRLRGFDMPWIHELLGLDVVYVILPLHGPRAETPWSGGGLFDRHPLVPNAAITQAIWDLRRLTGWLRREGVPALGVSGMSLGGYVAALYASLDGALACAAPIVPAVDLCALFFAQLPGPRRREWERAGLTRELLERAWRPHAPLAHHPRVPHAARLLVAGAADRITPPEQALQLWEHWERPALHWFPGSHLLWNGRAELRLHLAEHLRRTLGAAGEPPMLSHFRGLCPPAKE